MDFDSRFFRDALGRFATGVCVVTAEGEGYQPFGITVNSFASVSLAPPLVLWSIGRDSDCFDAFQVLNRYAINILDETQVELSNLYSRHGEHTLIEGDWKEGITGSPTLVDALAVFECKLVKRLDGGDHTILLGEVVHTQYREVGEPLVFYSGQYRQLDSV